MKKSKILEQKKKSWRAIYLIGGFAGFLAALVFRLFLAVELMTFNGFGIFQMPLKEPMGALEWFTLLENNKAVALILLGLVDMINFLLVGLLFTAIYIALRKADKLVMNFAIILTVVSISLFISSNQMVGIAQLSDKYHAAASTAQSSIYLASAEALVANIQGMGWYASLFLIYLDGFMISMVMRRNDVFNKATAWAGIFANSFGLLLFPMLLLAPSLAWIPPSFSAPFRLTWYILIALRLFKLSKK
jgi:hypothetical protein